MAGAGFTSALAAFKTLFTGGLAETPQDVAGTTWGNQVPVLLSQDKLAIDLDGSWLASEWAPASKGGVAPWPQWSTVVGEAAMPTENGQAPSKVSMSGGWLLSVGSHAPNKQMAFNFITLALDYQNSLFYDIGAGQIATRADVAATPSYKDANASVSGFSSYVPFTHFRPAFTDYPKLSTRDPAHHGPDHDGAGYPRPGRRQLQQVPGGPRGPSGHGTRTDLCRQQIDV